MSAAEPLTSEHSRGGTPSLSVILASGGRETLARTIDSVRSQLIPGDELLVSLNFDCPWGNAARNQLMAVARGDALLFIDDDDVYVEHMLDTVRARFAEARDRVHIFRMQYADGRQLWQQRELLCGNVGTPMVVIPRRIAHAPGCSWGERYEADFDFIADACKHAAPVWHEQVIALIRPD